MIWFSCFIVICLITASGWFLLKKYGWDNDLTCILGMIFLLFGGVSAFADIGFGIEAHVYNGATVVGIVETADSDIVFTEEYRNCVIEIPREDVKWTHSTDDKLYIKPIVLDWREVILPIDKLGIDPREREFID